MVGESRDILGVPGINALIADTGKDKKNNPSLATPTDNTVRQIPDDDRTVATIQNLLPDHNLLQVSDGQQGLESNVSEPDSASEADSVSEADSAIKTFDQAQSYVESSIEGILALYYEPIEERVGLLINTRKLLTTMSREIVQIREGNFHGDFLGVSERIENVNTLMELDIKDIVGKEISKLLAYTDTSLDLLDVAGQETNNALTEITEDVITDMRKNIETEADVSLQAQANIVPEADVDLSVLKETV